jgi:S-formylglutathione hydrolase FrmB
MVLAAQAPRKTCRNRLANFSLGPASGNRSMRRKRHSHLVAIFALWSCTACAQGRVDCSALNSRILQRSVRYCVLLPPSYEGDANKKYPVLYFLHGLGENEQTLIRSGGWGLIEDLEHEHTIGDFIIAAPQAWGTFFINSADGRERYSDFFLAEFLPHIEAHYRVIRERSSRGVTGLSMGGYGGLRFAWADPQLFGSVSAQSPALITESPRELDVELRDAGPLGRLLGGVFGNPIAPAHWNQNNPFQLARKNRLQIRTQAIYINCGRQDEYGFQAGAEALHNQLMAEKVSHEFHLYEGGHDAEYFLSHLGETMEFHWHAFVRANEPVR